MAVSASPESKFIDIFASKVDCGSIDVLTNVWTGPGPLGMNPPTLILDNNYEGTKGLNSKGLVVVIDSQAQDANLSLVTKWIGSVDNSLIIVKGEDLSKIDTAGTLHKFIFIERNKLVYAFCPQLKGDGYWTDVLHLWSEGKATLFPAAKIDPRETCPSQLRGARINVGFPNRAASRPRRRKDGSLDPYGIDIELIKIFGEYFGFSQSFTLTTHFNEGFSPHDKLVC